MRIKLKYNSDEVLEQLKDISKIHSIIDPNVFEVKKMDFNTRIATWRKKHDLLITDDLADFLKSFFNIQASSADLVNILNSQFTLKELCDYIVNNGYNNFFEFNIEKDDPTHKAIIFKKIVDELNSKDINTADLTLQSSFTDYLSKYPVEIATIVSKITPGIIKEYKIRKNLATGISGFILLISLVTLVISLYFWVYIIFSIGFFIFSIILFIISMKTYPDSIEVKDILSFSDLIDKMLVQYKKQNN